MAEKDKDEVCREVRSRVQYAKAMLRHLWKAWPLWCWLVLIAAHVALVAFLPDHTRTINAWAALLLQVAGAILVVVSIDSNLTTLSGQRIWGVVTQWVHEFGEIGKEVVIQPHNATSGVTTLPMKLTTITKPKTLEDRVAALESDLEALKSETDQKLSNLAKGLHRQTAEIHDRLRDLDDKTAETERQVQRVVLGGAPWQWFGAALFVQGAAASFFNSL